MRLFLHRQLAAQMVRARLLISSLKPDAKRALACQMPWESWLVGQSDEVQRQINASRALFETHQATIAWSTQALVGQHYYGYPIAKTLALQTQVEIRHYQHKRLPKPYWRRWAFNRMLTHTDKATAQALDNNTQKHQLAQEALKLRAALYRRTGYDDPLCLIQHQLQSVGIALTHPINKNTVLGPHLAGKSSLLGPSANSGIATRRLQAANHTAHDVATQQAQQQADGTVVTTTVREDIAKNKLGFWGKLLAFIKDRLRDLSLIGLVISVLLIVFFGAESIPVLTLLACTCIFFYTGVVPLFKNLWARIKDDPARLDKRMRIGLAEWANLTYDFCHTHLQQMATVEGFHVGFYTDTLNQLRSHATALSKVIDQIKPGAWQWWRYKEHAAIQEKKQLIKNKQEALETAWQKFPTVVLDALAHALQNVLIYDNEKKGFDTAIDMQTIGQVQSLLQMVNDAAALRRFATLVDWPARLQALIVELKTQPISVGAAITPQHILPWGQLRTDFCPDKWRLLAGLFVQDKAVANAEVIVAALQGDATALGNLDKVLQSTFNRTQYKTVKKAIAANLYACFDGTYEAIAHFGDTEKTALQKLAEAHKDMLSELAVAMQALKKNDIAPFIGSLQGWCAGNQGGIRPFFQKAQQLLQLQSVLGVLAQGWSKQQYLAHHQALHERIKSLLLDGVQASVSEGAMRLLIDKAFWGDDYAGVRDAVVIGRINLVLSQLLASNAVAWTEFDKLLMVEAHGATIDKNNTPFLVPQVTAWLEDKPPIAAVFALTKQLSQIPIAQQILIGKCVTYIVSQTPQEQYPKISDPKLRAAAALICPHLSGTKKMKGKSMRRCLNRQDKESFDAWSNVCRYV